MISLYQLQKLISDVETEIVAQDIVTTTIQAGKLNILYWTFNNGDYRTEDELKNKIQRIREELIPITNKDDLWYKEKRARIDILEQVLS